HTSNEEYTPNSRTPRVTLKKLKLERRQIKIHPNQNRQSECNKTEQERQAAREIASWRAHADNHQPAEERYKRDYRQPGKTIHFPHPQVTSNNRTVSDTAHTHRSYCTWPCCNLDNIPLTL